VFRGETVQFLPSQSPVRSAFLVVGTVALLCAGAAIAAAAFTPTDPLAPRQWYLTADHAFDYFPELLPQLPAVRVAVIDSGLDCNHPEFQGRIVAVRSFVGGSPCVDGNGHGTFVAGEIAAAVNNGAGIAGIAFPAQLLVAKIAGSGGGVSVEAEAEAIRWAADEGARVINLSLGGQRDPIDPRRDSPRSWRQMLSPTRSEKER